METAIAYIVLHYQVINETIKCIQSIKNKHGSGKANIILVDNCSPNETGKQLYDKYRDDPEVKVILNKNNLGFANGLNAGIDYLYKNDFQGFCVLLNNDTELFNNDWDHIIKNKYREYSFGVMGPDIVSLNGMEHSNPTRKQDITEAGIKKMIRNKRIDYFKYKFFLKSAELFLRKVIKRIIKYEHSNTIVSTDSTGVQLQGSCLILSPKYFEYYDSLYRGTFLYFEEAILRYRCEKNNLISLYSPEIKLIHKGSVSVKDSFQNIRKKEMFYLKHSINSCSTFLSDIKKGKE